MYCVYAYVIRSGHSVYISSDALNMSITPNQSINQSNYFIVRPIIDQRAGQLSLPHIGIIKTEKIELKHKNR